MALNTSFLSSIVGILKILEIVIAFLTWALACGAKFLLHYYGVGFVVFTGLVAFVVAIAFLCFYLFEVYPQVFIDIRLEGILSIITAALNFIGGVVAASQASKYFIFPGYSEAAAASFFAFVTMVLFAIDAFLFFVMPNVGRPSSLPATTTSSSPPNPNPSSDPNVPPQYATANY